MPINEYIVASRAGGENCTALDNIVRVVIVLVEDAQVEKKEWQQPGSKGRWAYIAQSPRPRATLERRKIRKKKERKAKTTK